MPCSIPQWYRPIQRQCPVLGSGDYIASIKTIIAESPVYLSYPNVNLIGVSIQYPSLHPTYSHRHERNKWKQLQLHVEISCTFTVKSTTAQWTYNKHIVFFAML